MTLEERVAILEQQVETMSDFAVLDPELATKLLGFWLVSFVTAHVVGRVVRQLGKT